MELRFAAITTVAVIALSSLLAQQARAQDSGWAGLGGDVSVQSAGQNAQVNASTQNPGGAPQLAGQDVSQEAGRDPWAKYTAVLKPGSDVVQLCLTVNAGLPDASGGAVEVCYDAAPPSDPAGIDPAGLAARAMARLTVPDPQIVLSPDPSRNQWNVLAVGLPIWVASPEAGPVSAVVSEQGIDIVLTATRGNVGFAWGDGTRSVCSVMRPRPAGIDPLTPSPDCGHTWLRAGDYTITATAGWAVHWQALGQSGVLPLTSSASIQVPIRDFESVVVG